MPRPHPVYPLESRVEAVRLARSSDRLAPVLATDLGGLTEALRRWTRQAATNDGRGQPGDLMTGECEECRRLRREVRVLSQVSHLQHFSGSSRAGGLVGTSE